MSTDPIF